MSFKSKPYAVRLPMEIAQKFEAFANSQFGGIQSDASRFIYTEVLNGEKEPHVRASLSVYHNLMPIWIKKIGQITDEAATLLKKRIMAK